MSSGGSSAIAAAMSARWRSPPESSPERWPCARTRVGHADRGEELEHPSAALRPGHPFVEAQRVVDLAADRAQRVERDERVLQDEADVAAADAAPLAFAGTPSSRPPMRSVLDSAREPRPGQAEQRARGDALARAGLADDRDALAATRS